MVIFRCWFLFQYPFHDRVTAVARERSRSACQTCMWQVTAKHSCTLPVRLCMKWHDSWLYDVHRTRRDGISFMWHQPCLRCKYTTSVDIQKRARITCERIESARERRMALYKSDHRHHHQQQHKHTHARAYIGRRWVRKEVVTDSWQFVIYSGMDR